MMKTLGTLSLALALASCASSQQTWTASDGPCKLSRKAVMLTADAESHLEDPTIFDGDKAVGSSVEIHLANQLAAKRFLMDNAGLVGGLQACEREALSAVLDRWDRQIETAQAYKEIDLPKTDSVFVRAPDDRRDPVAAHRKGY